MCVLLYKCSAVFTLIAGIFLAQASSECQLPFQNIGSNCYYFSYPALAENYIASQEYCEQIGSTLAILDTEEKSEDVTEFLNTYLQEGFHFIGGYNTGHENQYIWNSIGQKFTYTNWYTNSSGEYCVGVSAVFGDKWGQFTCNTAGYFICQKVNNSCYDSVPETSCSGSYTLVNGKCYDFVTKKQLKWIEAKEYCERRGDVLAILDTESVNIGVTEIIEQNYPTRNFWIGAYDQSHEGTWLWDGKGTAISNSNWNYGEPEININQNCLMIESAGNYTWNDFDCSETLNFICQKLPETCSVAKIPDVDICSNLPDDVTTSSQVETTTDIVPLSCDPPFLRIGGGCYFLQNVSVSTEVYSWFENVEICKLMGATIGYILDEEEQNALAEYVIALHDDQHSSCSFWIGLNNIEDENVWVWEGLNDAANFTAWYGIGPSNTEENHCAWINNFCTTGLWADDICSNKQRSILCRK